MTTYFGLVQGFETEFGYFNLAELLANGVHVVTDPKEIATILSPIGWLRDSGENKTDNS